MFFDRTDAGRKLAAHILQKKVTVDTVVGLAKGGIEVASVLVKNLHVPLQALVVKKIGSPSNPEFAIGAIVPVSQKLTVSNKSVLIVDDGMATGETMKAAIAWLRSHGAKKLLIAVPVAPPEIVEDMKRLVDRLYVLDTPVDFRAVGQYYKNFPQLTTQDVVKLLA